MSAKANDNVREGAKPTAPEPMQRFYKEATTGVGADGLHTVLLDGRPVRTPARNALTAPPAVAEAIAGEWNAQETHIAPLTMPLTRLVNTAIDGVSQTVGPVQDEIVSIVGNDLLVYRADWPEGLVARQGELWDPLVRDAAERFGVPIAVTAGIMPVRQDERLAEAVRSVLPGAPLPLAALHQLTTLTGSALIAIGVAHARLSFADGWLAAHVDEDWNIMEWGEDEEAAVRRVGRRRDAEAAAFVLEDMR